jgi:hypothetical protein
LGTTIAIASFAGPAHLILIDNRPNDSQADKVVFVKLQQVVAAELERAISSFVSPHDVIIHLVRQNILLAA